MVVAPKCPRKLCDRTLTPHLSGLGYECKVHGFVPTLELLETSEDDHPSDTERIRVEAVPEYTTITIGTESKGRLKAYIPVNATDEEAKQSIDRQLNWLWYAQTQARDMGLDILPSRSKKELKE